MTSYVFFANGFEEIEATTPVDVLRRAGFDVKSVSINDTHKVTGAHGITMETDLTFKQADFSDAQWLILPGGMPGAQNLYDFHPLSDLLKVHHMNGGKIAAICAAPAVVLAQLDLLKGRKATCYPGFEPLVEKHGGVPEKGRVVVDGTIVTANGPSSALPFALAIVEHTAGNAAAKEVADAMLV